MITLIKIKVHQDDIKPFDQLEWLKQSNILHNNRAKELIQIEKKDIVEWLFYLSFPCISTKYSSQIPSKKGQIKLHINKMKASSYLTNKLKILIKFEEIN